MIVKYVHKHEDGLGSSMSDLWHKKVSQYLETHPSLAQEEGEEEGEEDSPELGEFLGDSPDELGLSPADEEEEEEEEEEEVCDTVGVVSCRPLRSVARKKLEVSFNIEPSHVCTCAVHVVE